MKMPQEPMLIFKPLSQTDRELNLIADDEIKNLEDCNFEGHEDIRDAAMEAYQWAIQYNVDRSMFVMYIADVLMYRIEMQCESFSQFDKKLVQRLAMKLLSSFYEN